jgi:hypothetical protein
VAYANLVTETIKRFEATLRADGLLAAMRWLNERVPYRYSAVFGFDGDRLHNICLIDKENPNISKCPDQPITDSYCMYIQRSGDRFSVETALKDARVEGHLSREVSSATTEFRCMARMDKCSALYVTSMVCRFA